MKTYILVLATTFQCAVIVGAAYLLGYGNKKLIKAVFRHGYVKGVRESFEAYSETLDDDAKTIEAFGKLIRQTDNEIDAKRGKYYP